jgi:polyhydroxybutyrate depolymerase
VADVVEPGLQESHTLETENGPRNYLVRGRATPRLAPVLLFLHGAGGTAEWSLEETGWEATGLREGFLLVVPEGQRSDRSRPPGFLDNPQLWNDGAPRGLVSHAAAADDVAFLAAVLDDVERRYQIDTRRIYCVGFSNGAGMAFRLAAELSHRLAALAPVAGHCWQSEPHPVPAVPTLYLGGAADPLVPLAGGTVRSIWGGGTHEKPSVWKTLTRWAAALGCPPGPGLTTTEEGQTFRYAPGANGAEFVAQVIADLGHHWPGGRGRLSRRIFGPPRDFPANDHIWEFCRRQRR